MPRKLQVLVSKKLLLFKKDPFHPSLKNHALHGQMQHLRAISITRNIRIIFEEYDNYAIVLMLDIGSHNRLYE